MRRPHNERPRLMAHLVAGYPDMERTVDVARGLVEGGAAMLELQMPSSDPAADGPVIQRACSSALERGFRLEDGLGLAEKIRLATGVPLFIMAYGSQIFARGIRRFTEDTAAGGCDGVIAPDLTPGRDEGLYEACRAAGLSCVPVVPVSTSMPRVERILEYSRTPVWVYTALRTGITGAETALSSSNADFLAHIRSSGSRTIAGFGIRSPEQIAALAAHTDAVVVGSCFVRAIASAVESGEDPADCVRREAASLTGCVID
mgnify:CR=1 FL=1